MVSHDEPLSIRRQCELVRVNRSSFYYKPVPTPQEELDLMREVDELHLKHPFYGSRRIASVLSRPDRPVNRKRARRLMRVMGLEAVAPKPSTSQPAVEPHTVYPYLLRDRTIERVNEVWASDITYLPMAQGFGYLVAIMDWASRRVLSWRLSNTLDTTFCVEALQEALERFGSPDIFNTDQGAQFTSTAFTDVLKAHDVAISMDGRGRWLDNVFIERLWRTVKYEEVYLHAYTDLAVARQRLAVYFQFYNEERPHRALGGQPPAAFYTLLAPSSP